MAEKKAVATKKPEAKPNPKLAVAKVEKPAEAAVAVAQATKPVAAAKKVAAPRENHDTRVITVLATENPRREGTLAHRTFALYKTGMTVAAWREACKTYSGDPGYLMPDVAKGYIKLSEK